jgi:hypothetical protein
MKHSGSVLMKNKRVLLTSIAFVITILLVVLFFVVWKWHSSNYSPEVDAAIITAFVTVPITFLTLVGTVGVTYYFNQKMLDTTMKYNQKTIELSIQQQRTTVRDRMLEYRLEKYQDLFKQTVKAVDALEDFLSKGNDKDNQVYNKYIQWLNNFFEDYNFYLSQNVKFIISFYLVSFGLKKKVDQQRYINKFKVVFEKVDELLLNRDHIEQMKSEFPKLTDEIISMIRVDFLDYQSICLLLPPDWVKKHFEIDINNDYEEDKIILYRFMGKIFKAREEKIVISSDFLKNFKLFSLHLQYIMFKELNMAVVDEDMRALRQSDFNVWNYKI